MSLRTSVVENSQLVGLLHKPNAFGGILWVARRGRMLSWYILTVPTAVLDFPPCLRVPHAAHMTDHTCRVLLPVLW